MATVPPKRSWANVAATPPSPNVLFHVEPVEPYYGYYAKDEFLLRCIGDVYNKTKDVKPYGTAPTQFEEEWANWGFTFPKNAQTLGSIIVYYFEHTMLHKMQNPKDLEHIKMKTGFQNLANRLKCNVAVYLGHIESCPAYIENTFKKIVKQQPPNPIYPNTIFLIIGCYGDEKAHILNTDPKNKYFHDRNIAFFGFEDFMHFYDGDIYGCKDLLNKKINLECNYDNNKADVDKLLEGEKLPENLDIFDRSNPIYKCCDAKLGRIYKTFVDDLYSRNTTKYTLEKLYEKFLPFAQTGDRSLLTQDYTTIKASDGVPCANPDTCPISNPFTEQEKLAKEFNEKGTLYNLFQELLELLTTANSVEKAHEAFTKRIQNLKGNEKLIFNYKIDKYANPYLIEILEKYPSVPSGPYAGASDKFYDLFIFILTKYANVIDYSMISVKNNNLLQAILKSKRFTGTNCYVLFKLIYSNIKDEATRENLFLNKGVINGCPLFVEENLLLYQFYIQTFGKKLNDIEYYISAYHKGNLLHKLMTNPLREEQAEKMKEKTLCILGLLTNGMNPNQKIMLDSEEKNKYDFTTGSEEIKIKELKPLELYADLFYLPYPNEVFLLFYKYGMTNENGFLQNQIDSMKSILSYKSKQLESHENILEALYHGLIHMENDYDRNYEDYYNTSQLGGFKGGYRNYNDYNRYSNYSRNSDNDRLYYYSRLSPSDKTTYIELYNKYENFRPFFSQIGISMRNYISDLKRVQRKGTKIVYVLNKNLFVNCISLLTECLRIRRAVGRHGSTFKRVRNQNKRNLNQTLKRNMNALNFILNPDKIINQLMDSILTLAKKPQLTKEEKELYKKRPIQIKQSTVSPQEKRDQLQALLDQLNEVLKTR
jgi:hypothetical protein